MSGGTDGPNPLRSATESSSLRVLRLGEFCDSAGIGRLAGAEVGVVGAPPASGAAHSPQNFAAGGLVNPQLAHRRKNGAAHSVQNFTPSGFSKPQLEQRII